jgi:branched-chain amino acid transport system substrate-binding protein
MTALIMILTALAATACAGERPPAEERLARAAAASGDVVVAAAWPWARRTELRYGEGLDLAAEEINATGGITGRRLRIARFDDDESVTGGLRVAQQIAANPEVMAVIGHLQSFVSVPAAALYDVSGLLMIAPTATDPELTARGYRRVFRATSTDVDIGRLMAEFADRSRYRRVAIEYIRNAYGRGLANAFEERAGERGVVVVARQSYDPSEQVTERTFEPTLREWRTLELDAIFLAGEVPSAAVFIAQARAAGIRAPIFGGEALGTPALLSLAGNAAEGTIVATVFHPDEPRPEVRRFVEAFRRRYGAPPDAGSAVGYDAVRLLAEAMSRARSVAPDDVAAALRAVREWRGVTGTFSFDEHGNIVGRPLVTTVVHDQRFVLRSE